MKIEIDKKEYERAESIMALAKAHKQEEFGASAISSKMPLENFRSALLEKVSNADSFHTTSYVSASDVPQASMGRALKLIANDMPLDGLEKEFSDEMARRRGVKTNGIYVDTRALTSSSTSLISSYSQNVVPSLKKAGLYQDLGVEQLNVPDGKYIFPLESSLNTSSFVDLDATNTISASDPTLGSLTLEAKSCANLVVVSRNLLNQESIGIENYLSQQCMRSIARKLDSEMLVGSGSAGFTGVLNTTGINEEEYANGGSPAFSNLLNAYKAILNDGIVDGNHVFVMNPAEYASFVDSERTSGNGEYVIVPSENPSPFIKGQINGLGINVAVSDQLTAGNILLGDFSRAVMGFHYDSVLVEVNPYHDWDAASISLRAIADVSFGVKNPNAFAKIVEASA